MTLPKPNRLPGCVFAFPRVPSTTYRLPAYRLRSAQELLAELKSKLRRLTRKDACQKRRNIKPN